MAVSDMNSDRSSRCVIRKIIMAGDIVGKTCMVERFFCNTFTEDTVMVGIVYILCCYDVIINWRRLKRQK